MDRTPSGPPTRSETVRAALRERLRSEAALTSRELSQAIGGSERDVLAHAEHLERSLAHAEVSRWVQAVPEPKSAQ